MNDMDFPVLLGYVALLAVFSLAIYGHFQAPSLEDALSALRLPHWFSSGVVGTEVLIMVTLLFSPALGAAMSAVFLVGVSVPFAIRVLSGESLPPDCGCFGSQATRSTSWLFLRNGGC